MRRTLTRLALSCPKHEPCFSKMIDEYYSQGAEIVTRGLSDAKVYENINQDSKVREMNRKLSHDEKIKKTVGILSTVKPWERYQKIFIKISQLFVIFKQPVVNFFWRLADESLGLDRFENWDTHTTGTVISNDIKT